MNNNVEDIDLIPGKLYRVTFVISNEAILNYLVSRYGYDDKNLFLKDCNCILYLKNVEFKGDSRFCYLFLLSNGRTNKFHPSLFTGIDKILNIEEC